MPSYKMPSINELQEMLEMFIPNDAEAKTAESADESSMSHAAVYENSNGQVVGLCACDLPLAAALGASLSMIPPGAAEDMVSEGALTEASTGNLYEVMNMFSSLFMDDKTEHLKLTKVVPISEMPSLNGNADSSAFVLSAGNYGGGSIVFRGL